MKYRFADTPRGSVSNVELRRYIEEQANKLLGRNAPGVDPVEAQMKQQETVDKVFHHLKYVLDQVYSLYQQYSPDAEYFRVTGMQDMQKYAKGNPNERFDFYMQFDVATQDPEQMLERVKAIAQLGAQLDRNGTLDTERLLQIAVGQILPGAAESIMLPKETASQKAMDEERQTIAEIYAGVQPNVKPNDAHEMKLQIFQQWLAQPDVAQKVQQDPALQERIQNYLQQRQCRFSKNKMLRLKVGSSTYTIWTNRSSSLKGGKYYANGRRKKCHPRHKEKRFMVWQKPNHMPRRQARKCLTSVKMK